MSAGIIYNSFVCLVIGFTGLGVFYSLQRQRKKKNIEYSLGLDYFSLLLGLVWISVGLRFFLLWRGDFQTSLFIYRWFIGPLGYVHLLPAFHYLSWSLFSRKKQARCLFNTFFWVISLITVLTLARYGFEEPKMTYWGSKIKANEITTKIFTFGIFLPGFLGILIETTRRYKEWKRKRSFKQKQLLGFSIGFLIYALAGIFERVFFTQGWLMLLGRVGIMIPPLVFYFFASLEEKD